MWAGLGDTFYPLGVAGGPAGGQTNIYIEERWELNLAAKHVRTNERSYPLSCRKNGMGTPGEKMSVVSAPGAVTEVG